MRGLFAFLVSVALGAAVFLVVAWLMQPSAPAPPQTMEASITDEQFETARGGAGDLITGTVADWNAATEEARNVYAMGSADALLAGGGLRQERAALAAAFRRCMDAEVARATANTSLGDVSYTCAVAFQNGVQR